MNTRRWKTILLLLTVVWMAVIFSFSAQKGESSAQLSGEVTGWAVRIFSPFVRHLPPEEQARALLQAERLIRKLAHLGIYVVLGGLLLGVLLCYPIGMPLRLLLAFGLSVLYAGSDELHQLFVSERSASLLDVGIDSLGAAIGICCVWLAYAWYRRRREKRLGAVETINR